MTLKLWPQVVTGHLLGGFATLSLLFLLTLRLSGVLPALIVPRRLQYWATAGLVLVIGHVALGGWVSSNYAAVACIDLPTCHGEWWPVADFANGFHLTQHIGPNHPAPPARSPRLTLAQTPPAFRLGTAISVTLSSAIAPRIELPASAVQDVEGKTRIWVIDMQQQTVQPRDVTLVSRDASRVVLNGGVQPGERVVSAGVNSLKPGQKVKTDEDSPR